MFISFFVYGDEDILFEEILDNVLKYYMRMIVCPCLLPNGASNNCIKQNCLVLLVDCLPLIYRLWLI